MFPLYPTCSFGWDLWRQKTMVPALS